MPDPIGGDRGRSNFRLLAAMVAGEPTDSLAMIYEADDSPDGAD